MTAETMTASTTAQATTEPLYDAHGVVDDEACYRWLYRHPGLAGAPRYQGWLVWRQHSMSGAIQAPLRLDIAKIIEFVEDRRQGFSEDVEDRRRSRIGAGRALMALADELERQAAERGSNDHATRDWRPRAADALIRAAES